MKQRAENWWISSDILGYFIYYTQKLNNLLHYREISATFKCPLDSVSSPCFILKSDEKSAFFICALNLALTQTTNLQPDASSLNRERRRRSTSFLYRYTLRYQYQRPFSIDVRNSASLAAV